MEGKYYLNMNFEQTMSGMLKQNLSHLEWNTKN